MIRILCCLMACASLLAAAQNTPTNNVAVLDVTARVHATAPQENIALYSAEHIMQVSGLQYFVTEDIDKAMASRTMIVVSEKLTPGALTNAEYQKLIDWTANGGILVSPALSAGMPAKCLELFGVSGTTEHNKKHSLVKWTVEAPELVYFDREDEKEFFISQKKFVTTSYAVSTATPMAKYADTELVGVVKHQIGNGVAYAFGIDWQDVIARAQTCKVGNPHVKSNRFESAADTYSMFLRAAHASHHPLTVWKHTMPNGYKSVIMFTHDVDFSGSYQEMVEFAEYEATQDMYTHYFMQTQYFRQAGYLQAFYNEATIPNVRKVLEYGHTVGTHSIGHLPDFNITERFPLTIVDRDTYAQTCVYASVDGGDKQTTGGSCWAEIVLSKQIIEGDAGNTVKSFRPGNLNINDNIPDALVMGDFSYTSSYTFNDVWTQFPFYRRIKHDVTKPLTAVLEMPLHFSDVKPSGDKMTEDNWMDAIPVWMDVYNGTTDNYAPNIVLIHPTYPWKLDLQKAFLEESGYKERNVGVFNFEDFGQFWTSRLGFDFDQEYDSATGVLTLTATSEALDNNPGLGLVIETHGIAMPQVRLRSTDGDTYLSQLKQLDDKIVVVIGKKFALAADPAFAPTAPVERKSEIEIATSLTPATIYYTTDGTEPTTESASVQDKLTFKLLEDVTVKAFAVITVEIEGEMVTMTTPVAIYDYRMPYPTGDANGDQSVSSVDLSWTADHITYATPPGFKANYADVNADDEVSIADIAEMVDIILSPSLAPSPQQAPSRSAVEAEASLMVQMADNQLVVSMPQGTAYIGMQFDVTLPETVALNEAKLLGHNAVTHSLAYSWIGENTLRVLAYTLSAHALDGDALSITFAGELRGATISNILVDYRDEQGVARTKRGAEASVGDTSGIADVMGENSGKGQLVVYADGHTLHIVSPDERAITITSVDGRHRTVKLHKGHNTVEMPSAGCYVVGNKKFIF